MTYNFRGLFVNLLEQLSHDSLNMFLFGSLAHIYGRDKTRSYRRTRKTVHQVHFKQRRTLFINRKRCMRKGGDFRSLYEWIKGGVKSATTVPVWSWPHEKVGKSITIYRWLAVSVCELKCDVDETILVIKIVLV